MKTLSDAWLRAWYHGALWFWPLLIVLWPLSGLFRVLAARRRRELQFGQIGLPVPVVVVGNINVGGTGKTPLLCALTKALQQRGLRVGIISRGYGGSHRGAPRAVDVTDDAGIVGDEPLLLARSTGCPVVIGSKRFAAAEHLIAIAQLDVILSDDGMQHYALPRAVEIAVLDGMRGVGNGFCLPAGPLREPVSRLQEVDFVVVNGTGKSGFRDDELLTTLEPEQWCNVCSGEVLPLLHIPQGSAVHAVAGIGNPHRFFNTLRALGLQVIEHPFPDHHRFSAQDLLFGDNLPVVMTEKDAVKCRTLVSGNSFALRVSMTLPAAWVDRLLLRITENTRSIG